MNSKINKIHCVVNPGKEESVFRYADTDTTAYT